MGKGNQKKCSPLRVLLPVFLAFFCTLTILSSTASAGVFLKNGSDVTSEDPVSVIVTDINSSTSTGEITFFYSTNCGACHLAMAYLNEFSSAHPDVSISSYDLAGNSSLRALFEEYKAAYHRDYIAVPVVFIGNAGLEGEATIRENFKDLVTWYQGNQTGGVTAETPAVSSPPRHQTMISIPLALIAGLVDGINPCASAVLIFLLILLINIRQRQKMLLSGFTFAGAVFIIYFISGIGIYTLAQTNDIVRMVTLSAGCLTALTAAYLIKVTLLPEMGPPFLDHAIRERACQVMSIGAIALSGILGLIIAITELSCTGGIYLAILDMIAFRVHMVQGVVYLILYNLAFIVPLLVTVFLVSWIRRDTGEEESPQQKKERYLFSSLLLLAFALLLLTGIL